MTSTSRAVEVFLFNIQSFGDGNIIYIDKQNTWEGRFAALARRTQKQARQDQQQPYDNLLKSLLEGQEKQLLPYLLPEVEYLETLNVEVLRNPLRVDRVYKVMYRGQVHILHVEFESRSDTTMASRLLDYHAYLYHKYGYPVISIIIYPFSTKMAESPLKETSGSREILVFHFLVLPLWEQKAELYIQQHAIVMYALLPAMQGANAQLLHQAIEQMIEYYQHDEVKLSRELRWLGIMLRRADIVALEEKREIEERLNMYDDLMEKDPKMRRIRAESEAKGEARGEARGETKGLQKALVSYVKVRFPSLTELARKQVRRLTTPEVLDRLLQGVYSAPDEATARQLLESIAANTSGVIVGDDGLEMNFNEIRSRSS
jgi:predicted transposase YdaD